jgi:hypothetical protein
VGTVQSLVQNAEAVVIEPENLEPIAIQLDVDQSIVYGWIWGRSVPSLRNAFRLEQVTGIPAETWLSEAVAEAASAAP